MANIVKAQQALGMAMRAGKLVTGDEAMMSAIRSGKVKLALLANDASDNAKKKYRDKCHYYEIKLVEGLDRAQLGQAIGKAERVIIGVTDPGFVALVERHLA